jgi:hypothetical protein
MIKERLVGYIEQSIRQNREIEALSNYREKGYSYKEIAEQIIRLPDFMAVSRIRIYAEEFAKTPKRSIKRFLYTKE